MITIEKLKSFGVNVEEGLGRCMNNEMLYLRLVNMALDSADFQELDKAVQTGDLGKAYEHAHALKGVLLNLSLTPMASEMAEISDLLKAGASKDYSAMVGSVLNELAQLKAIRDE